MKTIIHNVEILLVEDNADDAGLTIRALKKKTLQITLFTFQMGKRQ